jgi:hypothetical protein
VERTDLRELFKYFSFNPQNLEAVRTSRFWFARPGSFNDPFDCAITVSDDSLEESVEHAVSVALREGLLDPSDLPANAYKPTAADAAAFSEFRDGLKQLFEDAGILCLTEVPDHPLMWSHYADSHRGFVVGLERREGNSLGRGAMAVKYQEKYPRLTASHFDRQTNPSSADVLWLTKASYWAYEREWRVISVSGDQAHPIDTRISSVILGMRMPQDHREQLLSVLPDRNNIQIFEAVKSSTQFALQLKPLS